MINSNIQQCTVFFREYFLDSDMPSISVHVVHVLVYLCNFSIHLLLLLYIHTQSLGIHSLFLLHHNHDYLI